MRPEPTRRPERTESAVRIVRMESAERPESTERPESAVRSGPTVWSESTQWSGPMRPPAPVAARRAVVRWAWRMLRREWRQQALVLALLTVAVAAAGIGATAAYNTAGAPDDADFGTADHLLRFETSPSARWRAGAAAAEDWFGTVEVIRHWEAPVPGSVERLELRAQDPEGPFGAPTLARRAGRYPTRRGEVAVTDGVAETFGLDIGSVLDADGIERTVVGRVENPHDLQAEFALVAPAEFRPPEAVTLLVRADPERFDAFPATEALAGDGGALEVASRTGDERLLAAVGVLGIATVALLLVALIASAGFVALAQRRLRQLGMLGALGATERHLRLVVVANGAVVGVVAAGAGALAGLAGWWAIEPHLEGAAGHRIDPGHLPWGVLGATWLLAIAAATAAAWWPARAVARVPLTRALSGRPPRPVSSPGSAALAAALLAGGLVCLAGSDGVDTLPLIAGTAATVVGVLLAAPLAIRVAGLGRAARRLPVAVRLALRDLARHQARSGVALAAISLVLGIPVAVVVTAAAAEPRAGEGNLADDQLLVRLGDPDQPDAPCPGPVQAADGGVLGNGSGPCPYVPERAPSELDRLEEQVGRITAQLDDASAAELEVAIDPDVDPGPDGRPAVTLAQEMGGAGDGGLLDVSLLYVATPELLAHYGLDPATVRPGAEVLTVESGRLWLTGLADRDAPGRYRPEPVGSVQRIEPGHSSLPGSFVTPAALRRRGWRTAAAGWLVESSRPLTDEQRDTARTLAAGAGLIVEARDAREGLAALRTRATGAAVGLALAVLAMTVGVLRSEAAGDLRTLTATGATSTVRRTLTASTAGTLALLGAVLGGSGAYLALIAGYVDDPGALDRVPVVHLAVITLGLPLVAAGAGWLLAGREPPSLTRGPVE